MRHLHQLRPGKAPTRPRWHHATAPARRRPSSQLIFDGVVAGYIHDISPHGASDALAFRRPARRTPRG